MLITFYGVRGSTPSPSDVNLRYGGNTACVVLSVDGEPLPEIDAGNSGR